MADSNANINIWVKLRDEAKQPLQGLAGNLKALQPQFQKLAIVSGAAFAAITGAVGLSVKTFVEAGDALQDMSERTGISAEALSELSFAASLSGTSIESVEVAAKMMSRTLVEAAQGSTAAADSLGLLGLNIRDFNHLSPEQAFMKMAEAVASVEDPMVRSRTAMEVFGRQGTDLLPMLSSGAAGLNELRKQAHETGSTFSNEAAKAAGEFDDKMKTLQKSIAGMAIQLGSAFLPILNKLVDGITPIVKGIVAWIKEHPALTAGIVSAAAAITGLVAALASFGLIIPPLIAGLRLLGITIYGLSGPVGWILGAIALLGIGVGMYASHVSDASQNTYALSGDMDKLKNSMAGGLDEIAATGEAFKALAKDAEETRKKIAEVEKGITGLIKENAAAQQTYKENLAQAFIEQEDKVADLKKQIQEKSAADSLTGMSAQQMEELAMLQQQLVTEQDALSGMAQYRTGLQAELTEMRRRAELTEFQLKVENIMRQRILDLQVFKQKLEDQLAEREALKVHLADLVAQQKQYTSAWVNEENARLNETQKVTAAIIASMSTRSVFSGSTIPFAPSAGISQPKAGSLFGPVRDAVITPSGRVIQTDPADYLIATKTPGALAGGGKGVTVNVYGDVTGMELVERVKEELMRSLRFDTKFSI